MAKKYLVNNISAAAAYADDAAAAAAADAAYADDAREVMYKKIINYGINILEENKNV
jgi:hypothetical protein